MTANQEARTVLEAARDHVAKNWTPRGGHCASVAIVIANQFLPGEGVSVAAHAAVLRSVGIPVPTSKHATFYAVYDWNDAQTSVETVVAAFDRAIAIVAELQGPGSLRARTCSQRVSRTRTGNAPTREPGAMGRPRFARRGVRQ